MKTVREVCQVLARSCHRRALSVATLLALGLLLGAGCATTPAIESTYFVPDAAARVRPLALQVRVQAELPVEEQMIAELAYREWHDVLPLADHGPYTGTADILFTTTRNTVTMGDYHGMESRRHDFSEGSYFGHTDTRYTTLMVLTLKDGSGTRLWSATHRGYGVSATGAAQQDLRAIGARLRQELGSGAPGMPVMAPPAGAEAVASPAAPVSVAVPAAPANPAQPAQPAVPGK